MVAQQEAGQSEAEVGGLAAAAEVGPALIGGGSRPVVRVGSRGERITAHDLRIGRGQERSGGEAGD